jgi:hypothetical protein
MDDSGVFGALFGGAFCIVWLLVIVATIAGCWKTFEKAGKPGWAAIVPIYNVLMLAEIAGKPAWWGLLLYVPCAGIIFAILLCIEVAKKFGKDALFGVLLALLSPIFFIVLGFGDAKYNKDAV